MSEAGDGEAAKPKAVGADLVVPLLALAFAAYFLYSIWGLAWEARANGIVIGSILVALIAVQLVRTGLLVATGHSTLGLDRLTRPRTAAAQRIALVGLAALFVGLLPWVGVTLGLFLFLLFGMLAMGVRSKRTLFAVALGVAAGVYATFVVFLGVRYPPGVVESLLAPLVGTGG